MHAGALHSRPGFRQAPCSRLTCMLGKFIGRASGGIVRANRPFARGSWLLVCRVFGSCRGLFVPQAGMRLRRRRCVCLKPPLRWQVLRSKLLEQQWIRHELRRARTMSLGAFLRREKVLVQQPWAGLPLSWASQAGLWRRMEILSRTRCFLRNHSTKQRTRKDLPRQRLHLGRARMQRPQSRHRSRKELPPLISPQPLRRGLLGRRPAGLPHCKARQWQRGSGSRTQCPHWRRWIGAAPAARGAVPAAAVCQASFARRTQAAATPDEVPSAAAAVMGEPWVCAASAGTAGADVQIMLPRMLPVCFASRAPMGSSSRAAASASVARGAGARASRPGSRRRTAAALRTRACSQMNAARRAKILKRRGASATGPCGWRSARTLFAAGAVRASFAGTAMSTAAAGALAAELATEF